MAEVKEGKEVKGERKVKEVKGEKKVRRRKKGVYRRLVAQMEFYFSDANLRMSKFLAGIYAKDPWVPVATFLTFNKISALLAELGVGEAAGEQEGELGKALRVVPSPHLALSEEGDKVTRVEPFKQAEKEQVEARTVYVENLPQDADHESLKKVGPPPSPPTKPPLQLFSEFGEVVYVSIPRFPTSRRSKGFAFVEFSLDSAVVGVLAAMQGVMGELASIKAFQEAEVEGGGKRKMEEGGEGEGRAKKARTEGEAVKEEEAVRGEEVVERQHSDLRVLSKEQWRKLRNKYLNEQRKNFSAAKQKLKKPRSPRREVDAKEEKGKTQKMETEEQVKEEVKVAIGEEMVPGLIVKVTVVEGVESVQGMKRVVREAVGGEAVGYVDCRVGAAEVWVRCADRAQAARLVGVGAGLGGAAELVGGAEEEGYWQKIRKDREEKRSGKVVVPKVRGRRKLVARIEASKSSATHVFFE